MATGGEGVVSGKDFGVLSSIINPILQMRRLSPKIIQI